jgi:CRP-like cAMP-binding protein
MNTRSSSNHLVRRHAFVRGLRDDQIARLAALGSAVVFDPDDVILRDGQRSDSFYLIVDGSVAVELKHQAFVVCVQALGPNDVFGWSSLLEHQDTVFSVRAREKTIAVRFDGADLAEAFQADAELGVEFLRRTLKVVAGRVKATEEKFAEMCGVRL